MLSGFPALEQSSGRASPPPAPAFPGPFPKSGSAAWQQGLRGMARSQTRRDHRQPKQIKSRCSGLALEPHSLPGCGMRPWEPRGPAVHTRSGGCATAAPRPCAVTRPAGLPQPEKHLTMAAQSLPAWPRAHPSPDLSDCPQPPPNTASTRLCRRGGTGWAGVQLWQNLRSNQ